MEDIKCAPKKTQLISLDSRNATSGTTDHCQFRFGLESNVFIESMKDVVGVRLLDFYITQTGGTAGGTQNLAKIVDIEVDEIPLRGQMLDASVGRLFARVPLERSTNASIDTSGEVGEQWKGAYETPARHFNPISLDRLTFRLTQVGDTQREAIPCHAWWFVVLEVTTLDHEAPKPDRLAMAIEELSRHIREMPPPQIVMPKPPEPKIPLWKVLIPIVLVLGGGYFIWSRRDGVRQPQPTNMPPIYRPG
jgi:hypothetical protein